jgi:two-component system cell cycle sensor histidine kinase/response regulator CckA
MKSPTKDTSDTSALASPTLHGRNSNGRDLEYRALLEAAPDAIVVVNQSGKIALVNAQAERLFGYGRNELIGRSADILVSEPSRRRYTDQHFPFQAAVQEKGVVAGLELFGLRKDGSEFPAEIRLSPLDTDQGMLVSSAIRDISDRRRTEEDLRRLASIVECSDDAIIGKTLEGIITSWNAGAERMYGYLAKEAIGKSVSMLVPTNHPDEIPGVLERLKRGEVVDHFETLRIRKDGEEFPIEITVSPIRDAMERIMGASTIGRDISERKRREEDLSRLAAVVESSDDAIIGRTMDGTVTHWNSAAQRIYGYSAAEIIGKSTSVLFSPDLFAEIAEMLEKIKRGDKVEKSDAVRVRRDGKEVHLALTHAPIKNTEGHVIGISTVARDISERRHTDETIRKERDRAQQYLDIVDVILLALDLKGRITLINRKGCSTLGWKEDELLGHDWVETCLPAKIRDDLRRSFRNLIAGDLSYIENTVLTKSGSERMIGWRNTLLRDGAGTITGTLSSGEDITERKHLEQQLRKSQKMEAIGQLAGGIAHDFNNLLSVILGYSEILLESTQLDLKTHSQCEEIRKAGERAASLTRQLLAFSRQQVLAPKILNLNAVVVETEKMLRRLIGEHIDLQTTLDPMLGTVKADPGQIGQVIINLVVNARDAMPEGGKLLIETSNAELDDGYALLHPPLSAGRYVVLTVSDSGIGMDEETQIHIFEPFFTTKEIGKGTGLGLSTVYGVVNQSGGFVWVYSELGHGSVFKIYLPTVDESVRKSRPKDLAPQLLRGTETVLLVEDEESVRTLTLSLLEEAGYRVIDARSGADALEVTARYSGPIHLLLTDVVMPGMNGPDLAERLSLTHPNMKALCMSGYTGTFANLNGLVDRCMELIEKPFSRDMLLRKVRKVLESKVKV